MHVYNITHELIAMKLYMLIINTLRNADKLKHLQSWNVVINWLFDKADLAVSIYFDDY